MCSSDLLTPALSNAIQQGALEVVAQTQTGVMVVTEDGQTSFALSQAWPGPDFVQVTLNGLVLAFGSDYTVEASTNTLTWLDAEITLKAGDRFTVIRGGG